MKTKIDKNVLIEYEGEIFKPSFMKEDEDIIDFDAANNCETSGFIDWDIIIKNCTPAIFFQIVIKKVNLLIVNELGEKVLCTKAIIDKYNKIEFIANDENFIEITAIMIKKDENNELIAIITFKN